MSRRQQSKARRIHQPQRLYADHSGLQVNHRHRIICPAHSAGTRSVPVLVAAFMMYCRIRSSLVMLAPGWISLIKMGERTAVLTFEEGAGAFEGLDGDFAVGWVERWLGFMRG
jgi:hypothetical protein